MTLPAQPSVQPQHFYRFEQRADKWLLLDPTGRPVFLRGINHCGDGSLMPWNLRERYGSVAAWRQSVGQRHRAWGFNYLPPDIGPSAVNPATAAPNDTILTRRTPMWPPEHLVALDLPFTVFLGVPHQYMASDDMPDVFSDAFAAQVDARCRETVAPLRDNPNLIGYHFCHNPPWNIQADSAAQWMIGCTRPHSAGRRAWAALMQRIYGSIARWRETYATPINHWDEINQLDRPLRGYASSARALEDQESFLERICERWHQVYCEAIRRYDPNHLILGDRNTLHLQPPPTPWALHIMRRYLDALSVNIMGPKETIYKELEHATRHWDGPIHLADTGACIYEGEPAKSAYQARDLAEWECIYRGLLETGLEHPQVIGMGWCGYYDTPAPSSRGGLIDCRTDEPLADRISVVSKWNVWMERVFAERYPPH